MGNRGYTNADAKRLARWAVRLRGLRKELESENQRRRV